MVSGDEGDPSLRAVVCGGEICMLMGGGELESGIFTLTGLAIGGVGAGGNMEDG